MIASSCTATSANRMRATSAKPAPSRITLRCCAAGRPAAAVPTTTALSPASTMSIRTTLTSAVSWEISSGPSMSPRRSWRAGSAVLGD